MCVFVCIFCALYLPCVGNEFHVDLDFDDMHELDVGNELSHFELDFLMGIGFLKLPWTLDTQKFIKPFQASVLNVPT